VISKSQNEGPTASKEDIEDFQKLIVEQQRKCQEEEDFRKKKMLEQQKNNPERWLKTADVPLKYLHASFESFKGGESIKEMCQTSIPKRESIMLCGKTGCGKTHLAVAMLRYFITTTQIELPLNSMWEWEAGRFSGDSGMRFLSVPELLLEIRASFAKDSETSEKAIIEKYADIALLILDDLGAEKTTEWVESTLYLVIDRRNRWNKWTIITSNLTLEEIEQHLGARIASRLSDMKVVNIKLPDYRKKR